MSLRDLPPAEFAHLSALMDEALDRPVHEREHWIDALAQREPGAAELLRSLVASASANADGFLETREVIERHLQRDRPEAPSLVGESIGPWRVLRPLGRGGMGTVWLAERADGLFQRRVALKLVHQHLAQAAAERFAREREILAALDHPNIARLLDAGFAPDGRPYLALEHVEGEALTVWSDAHRLPVRERVGLFLQVTRAVAFAHANLVIHRDLKPSNILVNADGQARLLDFGIAKLVRTGEPEATAVTQLAGPAFTPDYASPEQIVGGVVTTTSDVYALGVVLYELLCGARPYRLARATRAALEEAILAADAGRRLPPAQVRGPAPLGRRRRRRRGRGAGGGNRCVAVAGERGPRAGGARGARGDEGEGRARLPARPLPRQLGRAKRPAEGAAYDGARASRPRRAAGGQRTSGGPRGAIRGAGHARRHVLPARPHRRGGTAAAGRHRGGAARVSSGRSAPRRCADRVRRCDRRLVAPGRAAAGARRGEGGARRGGRHNLGNARAVAVDVREGAQLHLDGPDGALRRRGGRVLPASPPRHDECEVRDAERRRGAPTGGRLRGGGSALPGGTRRGTTWQGRTVRRCRRPTRGHRAAAIPPLATSRVRNGTTARRSPSRVRCMASGMGRRSKPR